MAEKQEQLTERLTADIPVELKRKIAAAAALRGQHLKDLVAEILEKWLQEQGRNVVKIV
jgi:uncharacterized protein (DUF1778 family)